ncbi:transporter substrate-binding domain-containing protein [Mitsuaria sp. WAJ17]|uniref:substrate-binding periplasmic protein n=1 Tax=Mitsuaria sp. WAJ17 TaxID=2761452 RepID=UPI001603AD63|nr:transporter substrate-binding domain-containing protein [Mitsuaria sp. WAJ17]MBB2483785.1 transporter substrate-binding domain-containing protein [Mitsuaria sp. WAJ17]
MAAGLISVFAPGSEGARAQVPDAGSPGTLQLCAEDENSYPWLLRDRSGLNMLMVRLLGQHLGLRFEVALLPWRRCLLSLQEGGVDGAFKASFQPERLKVGRYPMRGGQVDAERAMLEESYHLYRLKGSAVSWDGQQLSQLDGAVGAQAGFSIVAWLRQQQLPIEASAKAPDAILGMLQRRRLGAAALQTSQGDYALSRNPQFAAQIERQGPPLVSKPYYLMLSHAFVRQHPALAERIWDGVAAVRESAEYRQALQQALASGTPTP